VNRCLVQMCRDARGLDDPSDLIRCQDYTKQYRWHRRTQCR